MSSADGSTLAEQQRNKAFRRSRSKSSGTRSAEPPRQRRPGLAALAVLLIVGGALIAGVVAVRMDSREPVLAAGRDIAPGQLITQDDLIEVKVASEGLRLIPSDLADQVLDGKTYAKTGIGQNSLIDETMLTKEEPVGEDRAVVSVPLNVLNTPTRELRSGDLVEVIRVVAGEGDGEPRPITQAVVLGVSGGSSDDLGGSSAGSVTLLIPSVVTSDVVDASSADKAGVAVLEHGVETDTDLEIADTAVRNQK